VTEVQIPPDVINELLKTFDTISGTNARMHGEISHDVEVGSDVVRESFTYIMHTNSLHLFHCNLYAYNFIFNILVLVVYLFGSIYYRLS